MKNELNEEVSAFIDGSNDPKAESAYIAVKDKEDNFIKYFSAYWGEPKRCPCLDYELAESTLPEDDEYFTSIP